MPTEDAKPSLPMPGKCSPWDLASGALLIAFVCLTAFWFNDHGVSWDEPRQLIWGDQKLDFYLGVLSGEKTLAEAGQIGGSLVHPGFFDIVNALARRVSPFGDYATSHLMTALFGLLGMVAVWRTGRLLGGPSGGFWGLLVLLCLPRYFGHLWFNPKDIPFAALMACGNWATVAALLRFPKPPWLLGLALGAATGAALGVRLAAVLLFFYYGIGGLLWALGQARKQGWHPRQWLPGLLRGAGPALLAVVMAWMVALPAWPALWAQTSSGGASAMGGALTQAHHFDWICFVLFDGQQILSNELPRHYLPQWIFITTPSFVLLLLAAGLVFGTLDLRRQGLWKWLQGKRLGALAVLLAAGFPVLYVVLTRPILYDGLRHFLFVLPPLAVLVGLAARELLGQLHQWKPDIARLGTAALGLAALQIATWYALNHPQTYVFFNASVGGLQGAAPRYETDYWGLSFREMAEKLEDHLAWVYDGRPQPDIRIHLPEHVPPWLVEPFSPAHWSFTHEREGSHFAMTYTRLNAHLDFLNRPLVAVVQREGVPLNGTWLLQAPEGYEAGLQRQLQR